MEAVVSAVDAPSIYEIPLVLHDQGLDGFVCRTLGIDEASHPINLGQWEELVRRVESLSRRVRVGIVGKYVSMPDAYMSVVEALRSAGFHYGTEVELDWIDAEKVPDLLGSDRLRTLDGIVIPGGFGVRGVEGMVAAAAYARDNAIPCLGLCLGLQVMVIAVARDWAKLDRANSREFDSLTPDPVIDLMPDQAHVTDKGGTMRLGLIRPRSSRAPRWRRPTGRWASPSATATGSSSTTSTGPVSRPSAWCVRAARPTAGWSNSSS